MHEETSNWYYAEKGEKLGPFDLEELKNLVTKGKISKDTKVWGGMGDWMPAYQTALSGMFSAPSDTPPPLAGTDVYNLYVWLVVAIPIVGAILELLLFDVLGAASALLYLVPNVVLCVLDERKLKAAGHQAPSSWWCLIIPVYLWKRATLLKHKKHYFWGWVAAMVISIFITIGGSEAALEESACPIVTDIIANQLYGSATCKAVSITEEVSSGFYKATATLDNGSDIFITIEKQDDDMIYVNIPNQ